MLREHPELGLGKPGEVVILQLDGASDLWARVSIPNGPGQHSVCLLLCTLWPQHGRSTFLSSTMLDRHVRLALRQSTAKEESAAIAHSSS